MTEEQKKTARKINRRLAPPGYDSGQEFRAWSRGYSLAEKLGYTEIRDCRIMAMAYSLGWLNGRKSR
jgi:hypothetical protein